MGKMRRQGGTIYAQKAVRAAALIFICATALLFLCLLKIELRKSRVYTDSVLQWQSAVEQCARKERIPQYTDCLLAIMQVESNGETDDVMQSSESLGLEPDSLSGEGSIAQGCAYFAALVRSAEANYLDLESAVQAYNFGKGYLYYVAANGGQHTGALAEQFAEKYSGGNKKEYRNPVAVARNGGWRYAYGNMFYAELVRDLLNARREEMQLSVVSVLLVGLTVAGLLLLAVMEILFPASGAVQSALRISGRELKKHAVEKLVRNRGFQHGGAAVLLLYGAFFAAVPREFCGAVLIYLLAAAFYGAVTIDPVLLFREGGLAAVALVSVLLSGGALR
ncbi:MAG: DUF1304 family protein [Stomatobaculum sp.]